MSDRRQVHLFRNGRNQALRIPRDMELPGDEVVLYREGGRLVIEPISPSPLRDLLASWSPLDECLPEIPDTPPAPVKL